MVTQRTDLDRILDHPSSPDGDETTPTDLSAAIYDLGLLVYTPEGLDSFLRLPQPRFAGRTALDLMAHGEAERVLSALAADHEGLGF
jgi:hypothetical protein